MILHKYCLVFVGKYQNIDYFEIQSFALFMLWCYSLYITHKQQNKTFKLYRYVYVFNAPCTSCVDEKDTFRNIIHIEYTKIVFFLRRMIFLLFQCLNLGRQLLDAGKISTQFRQFDCIFFHSCFNCR